ncbi:MAG: hypothetical protein OER86_06020, partial [Phycisphaerae bacterium]|nr:hypothetical protein [Phycisphaerae bacterium]
MPLARRLFCCALLGLLLAGEARADEAAKKVIEEKGLTLRTTTYVLEGETKLLKDMGEIRRLKAAADGAKRSYKSFERSIRRAKAYIAGLRFKQEKLRAQRNEVSTRDEFDDLGKRIADVTVEINKLSKIKAEKENAARGKVDTAYAAYGQK